jgi:hypothetical protein
MTPYREAPPAERAAPPATLECTIADGDKWAWFRSIVIKLWITIIAAVFVKMIHGVLAGVVIVLGGAWMVRDLRRRGGKRVVFRTDAGRLHVGTHVPVDIPLWKLLDVRLDTKATKKALMVARADGVNTMFGGALADGRSLDVDASRIELVIKGRDPVLVSDEWVSSILAHEHLAAIKVFLRKTGWLPLDERPLEDRPKKKKKTTKDDADAAS